MENTPDYRIDSELWRSGSGVVYLVEDVFLGRRVVVKAPHRSMLRNPEFRARCIREFRIMAAVEHPNVVPVHAVRQTPDGGMFAVLPYIAGGDLRSLLDVTGQLSLKRTAAIADQVAQALDHVHARGLVHRDVNPRNILLTASGDRALITDFGIALETGARGPGAAASGAGTPGYSAPEQMAGERAAPRADVYALARVVLTCLTGAVPVGDGLNGPLRLLGSRPDLPVRTREAIIRAASADPAERFGSCGVFASHLRGGKRVPVGA